MLYNLCQLHLSTAHHLHIFLLTETDVPIGRMLRQDFFWKYGRTASQLVKEETVAHGTLLRRS